MSLLFNSRRLVSLRNALGGSGDYYVTSNLNLSCIELELGLGFDNIKFGVRRSILVTPI